MQSHLENLDSDSTSVIYSFLSISQKTKMAGVSKHQLGESHKLRQWRRDDIIINGVKLTTKSSISLYKQLSKTYFYNSTWDEYDPILEQINGIYCFSTSSSEILNVLRQKPDLAFKIMNDPFFRQLFAKQFPQEMALDIFPRRSLFLKIGYGLAGGILGLVTSVICSASIFPLWGASLALYALTFGLVLFPVLVLLYEGYYLPRILKLNPISPIVLIPLNIVYSFYYATQLGFLKGTRGINNAIVNIANAIFTTYFFDKEYESLESQEYFSKRETIAEIAANFASSKPQLRQNEILKQLDKSNQDNLSIHPVSTTKQSLSFFSHSMSELKEDAENPEHSVSCAIRSP